MSKLGKAAKHAIISTKWAFQSKISCQLITLSAQNEIAFSRESQPHRNSGGLHMNAVHKLKGSESNNRDGWKSP